MSKWRPIETVPNNVEFLIFVPAFHGEGFTLREFIEVAQKWESGAIVGTRTHSEYISATHWMPLPKPPTP